MNKRIKVWRELFKKALKTTNDLTRSDINILFEHPGRKSRYRLWLKIRWEKENKGLTKEEREHSRIICYVAERKMSRKRKKMIRLAKKHGMKLTIP